MRQVDALAYEDLVADAVDADPVRLPDPRPLQDADLDRLLAAGAVARNGQAATEVRAGPAGERTVSVRDPRYTVAALDSMSSMTDVMEGAGDALPYDDARRVREDLVRLHGFQRNRLAVVGAHEVSP